MNKKWACIIGGTFGLLLISFVPVILTPSVAPGVSVPDSMDSVILWSVETHFDHPLQQLFVFRYQITERQVQQGSMDQYLVRGKTFFGITAVTARVGADGIVTQ
ncbi:MAG: hypothetical protein HZC01_04620 [Candidatus Kerfeldbacteria bacterium]|nr:hypothetical protein [Candidatus Kerfeldbacteria bacterium]